MSNYGFIKICVKILYDTFSHTPSGVSKLYRISSTDLGKPCCKLVKACLQSKILVLFVRKSVITRLSCFLEDRMTSTEKVLPTSLTKQSRMYLWSQ